ncbi:hypothetical protein F2P56_019256 [Juglans regia]|uniref:Uncharacterized protein n=1 Tax=Juglans regia TaxID=51240 RepID=A0A833XBN6_JUGRE|nr:hypothetical protein F2P56_019256 [Juglans regia]
MSSWSLDAVNGCLGPKAVFYLGSNVYIFFFLLFPILSLNFVFIRKQEFCDFMQEMLSMMNKVKDEGDSFEDLQRMFTEMVGGDGMNMMRGFDVNEDPTATKKARVTSSSSSKGNAAKRSSSCC